MPIRRILAALTALAGLSVVEAAAQLDIRDGAGSSVRVGRNGEVEIRSSDGGTVRAPKGRGTAAVDCAAGRRLEVAGSGHKLDAEGVCGAVEVSGTGNVVHVRIAPAAAIALAGSRNTVVWTPADPGGAPPSVAITGTGNSARRG